MIETEREKFEAWCLKENTDDLDTMSVTYVRSVLFQRDMEYNLYENNDLQTLWHGWCAKAGISPFYDDEDDQV